MNQERVELHKTHYRELGIDKIENIAASLKSNHELYTEEAKQAFAEILFEKGLKIEELIGNREIKIVEEIRKATESQYIKHTNKIELARKSDRILSRFSGIISLPLSVVLIYLSLTPLHIGGLVSAIVWLGCAIGLTFFNKGD